MADCIFCVDVNLVTLSSFYIVGNKYQPFVTESSITLLWRPLNISAVLDISISADGYAERRTFLSSQNHYEIGGLLPDTRYNVSIWLLQPQSSLSLTPTKLSLIYNGSISTLPLGK